MDDRAWAEQVARAAEALLLAINSNRRVHHGTLWLASQAIRNTCTMLKIELKEIET